ncbi:hypothetical protein ONZ51_g988 [Trametes cubensis]|uniref:Uncharacterized protein n=1 Tax=Trametes cubensis TaxID=1111947 RepID=A0AAD7XI32_9APHY|nr:hypothetical protein ONZ51_g988 [Trametes cubensis]
MNYFRDPTFSPDYVPYYPHDSQGQQLCYAQTYAGDACLNLAGYAHTATLGGYQYNNIYQGPQPELQDSFLERAGYTGSMAAFPNMQFLDHSIDTSLPVQDLTSFNLQGSQASLTSIGGNAATVITPAGGEVITLASEFGVATSSAGSLYNEATGDAALFFPSSAAPSSEFPYIPPSGAAQSMGFMSQYSPTNPSMSTPSDIPPELAATTEMQLPRMQPFDMLSAIDDADMKKRNSRLDTHCIPTIDNDNQRSTLNSAQPIAVPNSADPSSAVTANEIAGKTPYLTPSPSSSRGTSPGSPARRVRRRRKLPAAGSPSAHGLDKRWKCPHCPYIQANKRSARAQTAHTDARRGGVLGLLRGSRERDRAEERPAAGRLVVVGAARVRGAVDGGRVLALVQQEGRPEEAFEAGEVLW